MTDRPPTEPPPNRNLPVPLNRSSKRRSWSTFLVWLGAFLAGLAVAGMVTVGLLLHTVEPTSTAVVFQVPAGQPHATPLAAVPPPGPAENQAPVTAEHAPSVEPAPPAPIPPAPTQSTPSPVPAPDKAAADHPPPPQAPPAAPATTPAAHDGPHEASPGPAPAPATPPAAVPPLGVSTAATGGGGGGGALAPAPDPQLIERTPDGVLPIVGADGRLPWQVYGRPFTDPQKRPRVAIVVNGLGLSDLATQNAIERLPPEVSLGFSPYAKRLGDWIQLARTVGHEVLVDVPLEPDDPENQDPGPDTLLSTQPPARNIARLHAIMGRVTGYVGLVPSRSDRFANVPAALRPILDDLRARGLLVLDTSSTTLAAAPPSLVRVGADLTFDAEPSPAAIDKRLADLEAAAKRNGASAGIGRPFPVTLTAITNWAAGLEKRGLVLAPLTAIVRR